MNKYIKLQILYCIIYAIIFYSLFLPLAAFCSQGEFQETNNNLIVDDVEKNEPIPKGLIEFKQPKVKTIIITKEDIKNAKPTKAPVIFSKSDLHDIEVMEKRHFPRTYPEFSDEERMKNLEYELLGKVWLYTPQKERLNRLKLASSNTMITGVALPASLSSRRIVKRMRNDSIQLRKRDDVGLIDGFLRLISPEKYEQYRKYADDLYYKYDEF